MDARRPEGRDLTRRVAALALVGLVPVVVLITYTLWAGNAAIEAATSGRNDDVAFLTRELVEREFAQCTSALRTVAETPSFAAGARARDEGAVRRHLAAFVSAHPRVVRAFVTDPDGLLWSDYPRAPESLGERFAHRDWYRGVSASWSPYVSRVYRRHARPQLLLVAVAVPVRTGPDEVAGALVCQLRLEEITGLLTDMSAGRDDTVFLVDHAGKVVAHPRLDLQASEHGEYADTPPVDAARGGPGARNVRYDDPVTGELVVASSVPCDVGGARWVVVVQRPAAVARRPVVALATQTGVAGGLALLLLAGVALVQVRGQRRVADLLDRLGDENAQRRAAEGALADANARLESRVAERTRELEHTRDQLLHAQKLEAVGRLAGGVAHDFNNLLTVILGEAELALARVEASSPEGKTLARIRTAGDRAAGLTRQLLAFSRRQVLRPEELDLSAVVAGLEDMLRRLLGEDVDLVARCAPDVDPIVADAGQVEQVVVNLAVNARDAMPEGGKLTIQTANVVLDEDYAREHADARPGPHVVLAVSDSGEGMDAETRAQIFDPFFTTKGLGHGTGLGLSTVYGIVKQSGGNIWVYSEPGRGTTFKVYFPRAEGAAERDPEPAPRPAPAPASATILLVEDDELVRDLVREVLAQAGYTVLATGSAEEARRVFDERGDDVELLLTDVVLPGDGGSELAASLLERRPGLPVLYMSGYTDDAIVRHGVLEPGTAFIEKPLTPAALRGAVEAALGGEA